MQQSNLTFRTSSHTAYYAIWLGGTVHAAALISLVGNRAFERTGFYDNSYDGFLLDRPGIGLFLFAGLPALLIVALSVRFFLLARRVTDRKDSAQFSDNSAGLALSSKTLLLRYNEIRKVHYRTIRPAKGNFAPRLHRLYIQPKHGSLNLSCSFLEVWELRRTERVPSIYTLAV